MLCCVDRDGSRCQDISESRGAGLKCNILFGGQNHEKMSMQYELLSHYIMVHRAKIDFYIFLTYKYFVCT